MMYQELAIPDMLTNINNPPKKLYKIGTVDNSSVCVAIVGSRQPTHEGESIAFDIAGQLSELGITVVSGLARGIDAAAHRGALKAKRTTIAVLPSGIKTIYPASHYGLARTIINSGGAVISEYSDDRLPKAHDFLARNRLIAGMCQLTIVIEAAGRSGSLNTAGHALDNNREVMAVPGSINNPMAVGTNRLIQQGATPLTGINDVLDVLGLERSEETNTSVAADSREEKIILEALHDGAKAYQELFNKVGGEVAGFKALITEMELKGSIQRLPGNYLRISG